MNAVLRRVLPREEIPALVVLTGIITTVVSAVMVVEWVPEDDVVVSTAVCGLLLGGLLAKRPLSVWKAWGLIGLYGLLVTVVQLGSLLPPLRLWGRPFSAELRDFWLQNGALFWDRVISWGTAVFSGNSSQETIVFAVGLGTLGWSLSAYAAWTTFRQRQPLLGMTLIGLVLMLNLYFGAGEIFLAAVFLGLVALLTAVVQYTVLVDGWEAEQIDYSDEVRIDLLLFATGIAIVVIGVSLFIPSIPDSWIVRWFASRPFVQQVEDGFDQAFGGVAQPREEAAGGVGGGGLLPRSYLLGNPPELQEIVMMRATVAWVVDGEDQPVPPELLRGAHWRSLSYEVYTGRGWALSEERTERWPANEPLTVPVVAEQTELVQQIEWVRDERLIRYSIGQPVQFDHPVTLFWRGQADFVRAQGETTTYEVVSRYASASPDRLRQTAVSEVPPVLLARYTALPDSVPQRVHELAEEVAGGQANPYDQARALEQFLRQYPYSLEVPLPPTNEDPVDYFLFDLQAGYCDYYASAMVVMARSLGLPARVAVGYLVQPPDESGMQTVYQINGHSWAELYFAGYGWVAFEPTATFDSPRDLPDRAEVPPEFRVEDAFAGSDTAVLPPPLPEPETAVSTARWWWGVLLVVALLAVWLWWQSSRRSRGVVAEYGRIQQQAARIGHPVAVSETPTEFQHSLTAYLRQWPLPNWLKIRIANMIAQIDRLVERYNRIQYGGERDVEETAVGQPWSTWWWLRVWTWRWRRRKRTEQSEA